MNKENKALISVVIPTVGRLEYLSNCLLSLSRQTILPGEVVVVDNSPNTVSKKLKSHLTQELNSDLIKLKLRYVREKRKGISFARNAGIRASKYDLVAFIDDDCIAKEDWIVQIIKSNKKCPRSIIQGTSLNGLPGNVFSTAEYFNTQIFFNSGFYKDAKTIYSKRLDTKNCIFRKSLFSKFPYFDTRFSHASDIDFGIRADNAGIKIIFDDNLVVWHFGRPNLKSHIKRDLGLGINMYKLEQKWNMCDFGHIGIIKKILNENQQKKTKKAEMLLRKNIFKREKWLFKWLVYFFSFLSYRTVWVGYLVEKLKCEISFTRIFRPRNNFTRLARSHRGR